MDALMQSCDVFISLHRSEGFGFGAAEALAAGKAVVATDYAGTTDFITADTGYPSRLRSGASQERVTIPAGKVRSGPSRAWMRRSTRCAQSTTILQ